MVSIENADLDGNGRDVPVGGRDTDHVFARELISKVPTKLATYPKSKSNPRGRPTARGEVVTGNVVGTMRMGKYNHFVYDKVTIVPKGESANYMPSKDFGILGNVEDGELLYSDSGDLGMMNHREPIGAPPRGNPWRYNAEEKTVYWWEGMPSRIDKDTVTAHLERKGYEVVRNKHLNPNSDTFKKDYESAHTFPLMMPESPKTPEFKNWFNNSKVVDENGNPKVVYHGTFNDFVEFDRNYAKDNYGRPETSMDMVGSWFTTEHQSKFYADPEKPLGDKVGKTMEVFLSIQNPYVVDWQGQNPLEVYTTRTKKIEDAIADFEETNIAFEYNKINEKLRKTGKGTNSLNDYERSVLLDYREERKKYLDNFREAKSNASKQDTLTRFSKIVEEKGGSEGFRDWAKGQGYDGVYLQETTGDAFGEFNPADMWIAFEPNQIKSATNNTGAFDPKNPNINFMPKKAKGAEGLRLLDDDVVQLDKSNLEYFMPAKGVNLEDYMDRKMLALAIDRLGIGQRKTGIQRVQRKSST